MYKCALNGQNNDDIDFSVGNISVRSVEPPVSHYDYDDWIRLWCMTI